MATSTSMSLGSSAASASPRSRRSPIRYDETLTPAIADRIVLAVRNGAFPEVAAAWLGISPVTFDKWLREPGEPYECLRHRIEEARALVEIQAIAAIVSAARHDRRAARELVERGFPGNCGHLVEVAKRSPAVRVALTTVLTVAATL